MSYQIKRLDPYGINHPAVRIAIVAGVLLCVLGLRMQNNYLLWTGLAIAPLSVLATTKLAVSAVLSVLGLVGGIFTFIIYPRGEAAAMSLPQQLLAVIVFMFFYTVLMDAVILLIAFLYNFFTAVLGMEGLKMDIAEAESEEPGS